MNGNGFLAQEVRLRAVPLPDFPQESLHIFALALLPRSEPDPGSLASPSHISGRLCAVAAMASKAASS